MFAWTNIPLLCLSRRSTLQVPFSLLLSSRATTEGEDIFCPFARRAIESETEGSTVTYDIKVQNPQVPKSCFKLFPSMPLINVIMSFHHFEAFYISARSGKV